MKTIKRTVLIHFLFLLFQGNVMSNHFPTQRIYLIPGQGADHRLFNNLEIEGKYEIVHIKYFTPKKHTSLSEYAKQLAVQIDTTQPFILIGVSLGGMLACEISKFTNPVKTIIISSAKSRKELPRQYTFQRKFPLYKIVGPRLAKAGAKILQPLVEPDRNKEKETFKNMLADKDPKFLRRSIEMILNWDRESNASDVIHIHGEKDNTIPLKNVNADYVIADGSHMMTLTRGKEVGRIVSEILN